jgi:hypothetical protein
LVTGVIREQLAEQVIASLDSYRVNCGRFFELHLGGGKFKFPYDLVLRGFPLGILEELLQIFEVLLSMVATSSGTRRFFSPKTQM